MKKLTKVLGALLCAMALVGCANPAGGTTDKKDDNKNTNSLAGYYEVTKQTFPGAQPIGEVKQVVVVTEDNKLHYEGLGAFGMDITLKSDLSLDYIIHGANPDAANPDASGKGTYKVENNDITINATASTPDGEISAEIVLTKTNWKTPTDGKFGQMKKYDAVADYEGYPAHIKIEPDSNNFKVTSTTNDSPNFKMTLFPNGLAEMTNGGITTKFVWVFNDNVISIYQQNGMGVKKLDYRLMAGETL